MPGNKHMQLDDRRVVEPDESRSTMRDVIRVLIAIAFAIVLVLEMVNALLCFFVIVTIIFGKIVLWDVIMLTVALAFIGLVEAALNEALPEDLKPPRYVVLSIACALGALGGAITFAGGIMFGPVYLAPVGLAIGLPCALFGIIGDFSLFD